MPQIRKISISRNNILPKLELSIENVCKNYDGSQDITYVPLFTDMQSCTLLTSEAESDGGDSLPCKPRKRQRLDHLSQEEKIMRRKMKNRVAAQTARDRKKARMAELEEQVVDLETERKMLLLANMNLQTKNETLEKENAELKLRLGEVTRPKIKQEVSSPVKESNDIVESKLSDSSRSLEHASFIYVPLQKEQDLRILSIWMMQFVYLPLIARMMLFLIYCNNVLKICFSLKTSTFLLQNLQALEKLESQNNPPQKWWGPHQKAWNPTKN